MRVTADVHLTPIGTDKTSISEYIAAAESILRKYPALETRLNPMSTTIVGDLDTVLEVVKQMHEAPFSLGAKRVSTSIRIDERREGGHESLSERIESVQSKIKG